MRYDGCGLWRGEMFMQRATILLAAALTAGCARAPQSVMAMAMDVGGAEGPMAAVAPAAATAARIAYSYTITYAFDRRTVAKVQGQQLALCHQLGSTRCLVLKSTLNTPGPDDHIVSDQAALLVDASRAGEVNRQLDALAIAGGATLANRQVEAEDVNKQVIDIDARMRAKQALADRLLAIVKSGNGKVGELVEAERAYAATQEELDATRAEQASLAQRVAMSRLTINYAFSDMPGRDSPIRASLAATGDTLAASIAVLLTAVIALLPWLVTGIVMLVLIRVVRRKMGWRWPRRPQAGPPPA
jgi:hypothetical protein